ncbi:hypothetical protein SAMN05421823_108176 [Catalinimonas alkaloidigena]|uniref:DUF7793 domain-containing protein n=1 Tax=Catalinimonas alkaloidigena TaxID=1075417 RepID=A0A1G9N4F1_9BACT|nr:hypothetical protein [Catalinimonas alkaloidigena]SDL81358.1 hypothetical protein SAMN05421823_108176 [Catalinimonas alkaloidigena]
MNDLRLENDTVAFELKDGILYGRYKVEEVSLEIAKTATAFRHQLTGGQPTPAIADISAVKKIPKEAREFFSSGQAGEDLTALAVVISNPVTRTIGNFFLKFHAPKYPFQLFGNVQDATNWIKKIS